MIVLCQRLAKTILRSTPYPAAIQVLVTLVLLATPLSALGLEQSFTLASLNWRFWAMASLLGSLLLALWLVPVRHMRTWAVTLYLVAQCGLVIAAQAILPAPLIDYVYLTVVIQAITVTRLWIWIPFAVGVLLAWSGTLLVASAGLLDWLQLNLALAFPTTCMIVAAVVYARQQRRQEQAQKLLDQVQERYAGMAQALREMQQRFALEERSRLAHTVADEVHGAFARSEQHVALAIIQAQTNLARVQGTVAQTRAAAGFAVERLRAAITVLRQGDIDSPAPIVSAAAALPSGAREEGVLSSLSACVLSWVLPSVFLALATLLTLLQHHFALEALLPVVVFGAALMALTVCTQRIKNPFWLHAGFAGQAMAVTAMALLTQTLPLMLGLLLVIWQIATRLSPLNVALFLTGLPATLALVVAQVMPAGLRLENVVVFGAACLIVGGPALLARRQLDRRRAAERQLAELSGEMERQTADVRTLAIAAERNRLAREFHDDLGNKLVLINLQLQLAEELASDDPDAAIAELHKSREVMRGAWQSVLAAADAALPVDGTTLAASLEDLVRQCRPCTSAAVELDANDDFSTLPSALACTVYRVAQEGLTNACKHATPQRIVVQVTADENLVTVTVSDDGVGTRQDPLVLEAPLAAIEVGMRGSYGLAGLRERAELMGGGFEAGPVVGGGFRVRMVLPADETPHPL